MKQIEVELQGEEAMVSYGEELATKLAGVGVVYLQGNLGMGKTTLVRGFLRGHGYHGAVKSPTYTIVEPYEMSKNIYHFDLYRLGDPEELEYIGIRDYFENGSTALIEWPDKGSGYLPEADVVINIDMVRGGRRVQISAMNEVGDKALTAFA